MVASTGSHPSWELSARRDVKDASAELIWDRAGTGTAPVRGRKSLQSYVSLDLYCFIFRDYITVEG